MLLGDVIRRLEDETVAEDTVARLCDPALLARMEQCAEDSGLSLGVFAAWAVRHYADTASPDEWATLMGALERAPDPGAACLRRAFAYVLATHPPAESTP